MELQFLQLSSLFLTSCHVSLITINTVTSPFRCFSNGNVRVGSVPVAFLLDANGAPRFRSLSAFSNYAKGNGRITKSRKLNISVCEVTTPTVQG